MPDRTRTGPAALALTGAGLGLLAMLIWWPTQPATGLPQPGDAAGQAAGNPPRESDQPGSGPGATGPRTNEPRARMRTRGGDPAPGFADPRPIRLGTEKDHYQALCALLRRDPDAFRAKVDTVLSSSKEVAERVAALRVWYDNEVSPRLAPFSRVLHAKDPKPVRDFALRFLVERARRDAAIRQVLAEYVDSKPAEPRCRAEALFGVLRWGEDLELHDRWNYLNGEANPGVLSRAMSALRDSDAPAAPTMLAQLQVRLRDR